MKMTNTWLIILLVLGVVIAAIATFILLRILKMKEAENRRGPAVELKVTALKIIMPLKVQAYERFLLYLERVQLPQLVKRVYVPGIIKWRMSTPFCIIPSSSIT